jgi:stress response protein YsnF
MTQQTIVGLYATRALADNVRSSLRDVGISDNDISIGSKSSTEDEQLAPKRDGGLWDWLFGSELSDADRDRYSGHLRSGRIAVSVRAHSDVEHEKIVAVLERFDPIDIDGDETPHGSVGELDTARSSGASPALTGSATFAAAEDRAAARRIDSEGDRVIPLTKEELEVGKRHTEHRFRVRTHVIERPVEQQVHLRDERVVIERRPASGAATVEAEGVQAREFEVVERREEPVVGKRVAANEEVVIRTDATERVETVRDTVRETKLDVDKAAAGSKPSLPRAHNNIGED